MCTVTWIFEANGYQLFFNRDELKSRQQALPPAIKRLNNQLTIMPIDPEAGGTWISVNEDGLTLCLLNNYAAQAKMTKKKWVSRGLLVQALSTSKSLGELKHRFEQLDINHYRPFDLLALSSNCHICQLSWTGVELTVNNTPIAPLTSSSFATDEVISERLEHFDNSCDRHNLKANQLLRYHASHNAAKGSHSVCMHRDDGQTVSFSHIQVTPSSINFDYYDGSPCSTRRAHRQQINPRKAARAFVA